jgi:hypothetical protein
MPLKIDRKETVKEEEVHTPTIYGPDDKPVLLGDCKKTTTRELKTQERENSKEEEKMEKKDKSKWLYYAIMAMIVVSLLMLISDGIDALSEKISRDLALEKSGMEKVDEMKTFKIVNGDNETTYLKRLDKDGVEIIDLSGNDSSFGLKLNFDKKFTSKKYGRFAVPRWLDPDDGKWKLYLPLERPSASTKDFWSWELYTYDREDTDMPKVFRGFPPGKRVEVTNIWVAVENENL